MTIPLPPAPADPTETEAAAFIGANLPVAPVPGIPEIRLHGARPESRLRRLTEPHGKAGQARSPYWAYQWAGGAVLARYLLDRPETVRGRRVLDLGTGSGLVAIAAAKAGARAVTAVDIDTHAAVAARLNAALNDVVLAIHQTDLIGQPAGPSAGEPSGADPAGGLLSGIDLITAGDLFYERSLARRVTAFLDRCLGAGITILVGDPGRAHLPRQRLTAIAEYRVPDFGEAGASTPAKVFTFGANGGSRR